MSNTSNPTLRAEVFREAHRDLAGSEAVMTMNGTLSKSAALLLAVAGAAVFTWQKTLVGDGAAPWALGGAIAGLVLGLIVSFKPKLAPTLALPYALAQGLFLGAISATYAQRFGGPESGLVLQAVTLTFGVALSMLVLYALRIIRVTERLRSIVLIATGGVMVMYLVSFLLSLFMHSSPIGMLHSSGTIGIGFSLFVVGLAAFNLLMDFDLIERGAASGAPKYMEWYGAFALIVTLIWLYLEILRLLSKLRSRN
ncbi:MAG: Bax inhibitor-1/YccA family protein [Planctomycetota bacterium]